MPTNREGLGIKTTQPFIERTHNYVTPEKLLTPLQNIDFHPHLYGINFAKAVNELGGKHE